MHRSSNARTLRSNLSTIDAEIAKMQTAVGPNNPKISEKLATRQSLLTQMDAQIGEYRKKLKDRIAAQTEKVATLEEYYTRLVELMIGVQGQREHLYSLMRDVQFHQDELDRVQKAASTRVCKARCHSPISPVLDAPRRRPRWPSPTDHRPRPGVRRRAGLRRFSPCRRGSGPAIAQQPGSRNLSSTRHCWADD